MNAVVSDQDQSNNVAEFKAPGPGERLKAARLSLNLDIAKMAETIHLTKDAVDCLERDDYSEMPARVFVRGYIRNYARVVDLPADSVLRQFDDLWPEDNNLGNYNTPAPRLPADVKPGNGWVSMMTWLLLLGGGALFLVWWQGYLDQFIQKLEAPSVHTEAVEAPGAVAENRAMPAGETERVSSLLPAIVDKPAVAAAAEGSPSIGSGTLALPSPAAMRLPKATPPAAEVAVVEPVAPLQASAASFTTTPVDEVVADSAPVVEETIKPELKPEPEVVAEAAQVIVPEKEAAPFVQGIVVNFESASWVDIRDSSRKFKIFGEMKKGTSRKLGGSPPYKVVIGNAEGVSISVNGKPFDMATYVKGNVARFTLKP